MSSVLQPELSSVAQITHIQKLPFLRGLHGFRKQCLWKQREEIIQGTGDIQVIDSEISFCAEHHVPQRKTHLRLVNPICFQVFMHF